jgi:hypothetical protein
MLKRERPRVSYPRKEINAMRGHTTFTAIPSNVLKVEARASMSASFEVCAPPMKQLVPVAGQHIMQPQRFEQVADHEDKLSMVAQYLALEPLQYQ